MENAFLLVIFVIIFLVVIKVSIPFLSESKVKKKVSDLVEVDESFAQIQDEFGREKSAIAITLESLVMPFRNVKAEESEVNFKLQQAGVTSPDAPAYYLFFSTLGPVIGAVVMAAFYFYAKTMQGMMFYMVMVVGLIWFVIIAFGANLWLKNATQRRQKILLRSFPDTLDLLLVCVESGLALDAALARVCKELKYAHPEMTVELNKLRVELTMLNDRERALINFTKRTDLVAVKSLVAALLQSEKFGTSLIETLRVLSDDYRQTRMMLAEEKAGKLPTKIAVTTIPLMLSALLLLIVAPAIIQASNVWKQSGPDAQQ